jgi:hypothetical protein
VGIILTVDPFCGQMPIPARKWSPAFCFPQPKHCCHVGNSKTATRKIVHHLLFWKKKVFVLNLKKHLLKRVSDNLIKIYTLGLYVNHIMITTHTQFKKKFIIIKSYYYLLKLLLLITITYYYLFIIIKSYYYYKKLLLLFMLLLLLKCFVLRRGLPGDRMIDDGVPMFH